MKDETHSETSASHAHAHSEPKHQFEHEPTVIHNPEEDMTVLAKWLKHGLDKGPKFWGWGVAAIIGVIVLGTAASMMGGASSPDHEAWSELAVAQTPGQKLEVAEEHPTTDAGRFARLQAGTEYFYEAVRDLPSNKEAALPLLRKALDQFQQVAKEAPEKSPEALAAAMGIARTHETRNELPEAIQQYKTVIQKWPGSPEAKEAERLVTALQDPQIVAFYKDFHAFKAPSAVLPPGGSSSIDLPGLPANHPDLNGPTIPASGPLSLPALPTPPGGTSTATPPPAAEKGAGAATPNDLPPPPTSLPTDPFAKPAAPKK